mmetsp:Transcript_17598/g.30312  ORF Transcript_17598/g.30312 Transcript_17598/m.30312 type:complete len:145 (-) Transcript_17598:404-838(-)
MSMASRHGHERNRVTHTQKEQKSDWETSQCERWSQRTSETCASNRHWRQVCDRSRASIARSRASIESASTCARGQYRKRTHMREWEIVRMRMGDGSVERKHMREWETFARTWFVWDVASSNKIKVSETAPDIAHNSFDGKLHLC